MYSFDRPWCPFRDACINTRNRSEHADGDRTRPVSTLERKRSEVEPNGTDKRRVRTAPHGTAVGTRRPTEPNGEPHDHNVNEKVSTGPPHPHRRASCVPSPGPVGTAPGPGRRRAVRTHDRTSAHRTPGTRLGGGTRRTAAHDTVPYRSANGSDSDCAARRGEASRDNGSDPHPRHLALACGLVNSVQKAGYKP